MSNLLKEFYKNDHKLASKSGVVLSPVDSTKTYNESTLSKRPVLYLDFDGVINFFGSRTFYSKHAGLGYLRRNSVPINLSGSVMSTFPLNYSNELLRKLNGLDMDVLWLTTWRDHTAELEKTLDWHKPSGTLHWGDSGAYSSNELYGDSPSKLAAIVNDQTFNPRPFVWADDAAITHYHRNENYRDFLSNSAPHLTLEPSENTGLTLTHYRDMVNFLDTLKEVRPHEEDNEQ